MIDIERFLHANTPILPNDLSELEKIAEQYPWFALAHQLILAGYKQNNDTRYPEKCTQTAIYTLNRKRLYFFLEKIRNTNNNKQESSTEANTNNDNQLEIDKLLLNFSHEYFSLDDHFAPVDEPEHQESSESLIDKFIHENPRIVPKSPLEQDNINSLIQIDDEDDSEPVSETLAQIYVSQNLYNMAISCYEKLSLLNPEKSVYFASLIKDLKNRKK